MWRKEQGIMVLMSVLITLLVISPLFYMMHRHRPQQIATVDLQSLVEEEQKHILAMTAKQSANDQQRAIAEKLTVDFAKKLSATMAALSQECQCIIVNKAAIVGGNPIDYTPVVRESLKR